MSEFDEIKQHLSNNFDNLDRVLQIESRAEFSIIDYQGQSFIIIRVQDDDNTFTIELNGTDTVVDGFDRTKIFKIGNAKIVGFIPIDGKKGLLGFGDSHCDFVIFDKNDFCFVEFKLNGTSFRKVSKNREKAVKQLGNTIDFFDRKLDKNYVGLNLEAYVCTLEFYPRDNATWKSLAIEFLENYGIALWENNHKIRG